MSGILTTEQLQTQRTPGQWSRAFLAIPEYHTIYTAVLDTVPTSNDLVAEIEFTPGDGVLGDVLPDMTLYVGTTEGAHDLGMCRIRKAPISGTFYIGPTSDIIWSTAGTIYLTVVDDYSIWQKVIRNDDGDTLMDWEVPYTDQHEAFDPVPCMGSHRVAKLTGISVQVTLGPSADTAAFAFDSEIVARTWSIAGAMLDDDTAINPVATITAPGTYLAYCEFESEEGKTFTGVRYVIVYDDDNPLVEVFDVSGGGGTVDKGGYSFGVTMYADTLRADLRERSLVILCTEDFAEAQPITMPGQIQGAENIVCVGWISDITTQVNSESGDIAFTVESAEFWLRQVRDFPVDLFMQTKAAGSWKHIPYLSPARACWHFLHWRSTATRVMDVRLDGDGRLKDKFQSPRENIWDRMAAIATDNIFASPFVDNFGRLFILIDPQMFADDDRLGFPVVMEILDDDIEGNIQWVRRDVRPLSMLFFSGQRTDSTGNVVSYFSLGYGHAYGQHGGEDTRDNYIVSSQAHAEELCGNLLGWRNNRIDNLNIRFVHSMRYACIAPHVYFHYELSPADDPRGIGFVGNLIPRGVSFSITPTTKFLSYDVTFEPEAFALPAIKGDPPGMEEVDFSTGDFPSFPELPELIIAYPSTEVNPNHPKKVVIGCSPFGVLYTENFNDELGDVEWKTMNDGLDEDDCDNIYQLVKTPSGALFLATNNYLGNTSKGVRRIYWASGLGATWNLYYDALDHNGEWVTGIGVDPTSSERIAFHTSETFVPAVSGGTFPGSYLNVGDRSGYTANLCPHGAPLGFNACREYKTAVVFSGGQWFVFGSRAGGLANIPAALWDRFSASGAFANDEVEWDAAFGASGNPRCGYAPSAGDTIYIWSRDYSGYTVFTDEGDTFNFIDPPLQPTGTQGIAFSPSGVVAMGNDGGNARYTDDSTATWSAPAGAFIGPDVWEDCGDDNRFIFGGGIVIRLTTDLGATAHDKSGNLGYIAPLLDITNIVFYS